MLRRRTRERPVAVTAIADPEEHTVMDRHGAVRSIQAADITLPLARLDAVWTPLHLERLARTYWRFLSRVSLGLIRVRYGPRERAVVLVARPLVLLRFGAPEYELTPVRGTVRWRIRSGLLVDRRGHEGDGYLEIDVARRRGPEPGMASVRIEVEVANFYPSLASRIARWFYANTQSRIHVLVTHSFLRSLAGLELERSAVGRFEPPEGRAFRHAAELAARAADRRRLATLIAIVAALVAGLRLLRRR